MRFRLVAGAALAVLATAPLQAQYAPAGTLGSLPANSFGGSGIPTTNVMLGFWNGATIGLSATQSYASPVVTTNGAGTYYSEPGNRIGAPPATTVGFARWNFNFYIMVPPISSARISSASTSM